MKRFLSLTFLGLLCLISSCKKDNDSNGGGSVIDTPLAPNAQVRIAFRNTVASESIANGQIKYVNANGDPYSVDLLKYYVSHITLIRDDSTEFATQIHKLMDNSDTASMRISLDAVPNGRYVAVRFYLGVDSIHNHSGSQFGDLDPVNGMIWTWNTGYIFFKHEGNYKDKAAVPHALVFHLGTDAALTTVRIGLPAFEVRGVNRQLNLLFDLSKLYAGPPMIDFNTDNNRMSATRDDARWIETMHHNMAGAFSFESAQ